MIDDADYSQRDLEVFAEFVLSVLDRMAENRDVMSAGGLPALSRFDIDRAATRLRASMVVDASAIGMPMETTIEAVRTKEQPGRIVWLLDDLVLIATTPVDWSPERVADEALEMNHLLDAHRKWVSRSFEGRGR